MKWFGRGKQFVTVRVNGQEFTVPCGGVIDLHFDDATVKYDIKITEEVKRIK